MGNHVAEVVEGLPSARSIKVHARMCSELLQTVIRVSKIFPEIEAARPGCSSGIDALCLLNNGIVKAKSLLQHCSESSVLYLALTGEAILSRCKKSRNLLEQSLCQIQNMVPVMLAAKLSGIIADLRSAAFCLEPTEEEAGKILRELLHRFGSTIDSTEESALGAIHTVSSHLHISSQKDLLIEKRSIRRLLDKFGDNEPSKKKILLFFLNLLNKYGKIIAKEQKQQNGSSDQEDPFPFSNPYYFSGEVELHVGCRSHKAAAQIDVLSRPVPPDEFTCPLSSRLMYDPVVISSGQTYERMWIQKWFDEGHDTCPKTNKKLSHLSFTSNTGMKDLILKWCSTHNLSVPDPKFQEAIVKKSWETSMNSIASLSSSMNDLYLPSDFSNVSLGSGQDSDPSYTRIRNDVKPSRDINAVFFSKFSTLPWDSQCNAVEEVKRLLKLDDESWSVIPSGKFIHLILQFLKDARDRCDMEAQMAGCMLLCEFVQKHGNSISCMKEDEYGLLVSFLDTQFSKQALSILEILSSNKNCAHNIASSGALTSISNILDGKIQDLLEPSLKIMSNLSAHDDIVITTPADFIPKLIPFIEDDTLARYTIVIFKNMCGNEEARISIAETKNCIDLIAKLLEKDDLENQECAVYVLLSLCINCAKYCELVMEEGVIPGLVSVSINGNKKAKAMAMELLRILKDEFNCTNGEKSGGQVSVDSVAAVQWKDEIAPRKAQGIFGKLFSKPRVVAGKKKR